MSEQQLEEGRRQGNGDVRPEQRREEASADPAKKSRMRLRVGVGLAVVAVAGLLWWLHARKFEDTDDAQVDGYITAVSPRVTGTVSRVLVEDNQTVKQGDLLVELDTADLEVALVEARANAPRQLVAREAGLSVRQANLELARAQLRQAQLNLGYAKVVAPLDGIIGKRSVNVGDRVQPGQQLMSLTQNGELWVTANFRETQIERMKRGQQASIHVDAIHRDYDGVVESFAGATGSRYSLLPPENATGNYVKVVQRIPVRIKLEQGQPEMERLRPGMSAEPKVRVR